MIATTLSRTSMTPKPNGLRSARARDRENLETWSVRGSIRCMWLRSATSGIDLAGIAGRRRIDPAANLDPVDDEIDHRLHAHRLDDVEPHLERRAPGAARRAPR